MFILDGTKGKPLFSMFDSKGKRRIQAAVDSSNRLTIFVCDNEGRPKAGFIGLDDGSVLHFAEGIENAALENGTGKTTSEESGAGDGE